MLQATRLLGLIISGHDKTAGCGDGRMTRIETARGCCIASVQAAFAAAPKRSDKSHRLWQSYWRRYTSGCHVKVLSVKRFCEGYLLRSRAYYASKDACRIVHQQLRTLSASSRGAGFELPLYSVVRIMVIEMFRGCMNPCTQRCILHRVDSLFQLRSSHDLFRRARLRSLFRLNTAA